MQKREEEEMNEYVGTAIGVEAKAFYTYIQILVTKMSIETHLIATFSIRFIVIQLKIMFEVTQ